jgi:hypothetical protein
MKYILILLFIPSTLFAEWTTQDTVFELTSLSLISIDAWQTYTFLYTGNYKQKGHHEDNPILGKYPAKQKFFTYWTTCIIGHSIVSYILPKPYRSFWQFFWIGAELKTIHHNYQMGVRLKLPR